MDDLPSLMLQYDVINFFVVNSNMLQLSQAKGSTNNSMTYHTSTSIGHLVSFILVVNFIDVTNFIPYIFSSMHKFHSSGTIHLFQKICSCYQNMFVLHAHFICEHKFLSSIIQLLFIFIVYTYPY